MTERRLERACQWARSVGALIRANLRTSAIAMKEAGHRQATVDGRANNLLMDAIQKEFPQDGLITEEHGSQGGDREFVWMFDPVDGTSNLMLGIPYAGTAIALFHRKELVGSVVFCAFSDELFVAKRGAGASCNGARLQLLEVANENIGYYVQGYGVPAQTQLRILHALLPFSERVLQTWAPALDWCNLASGGAGFLVAFETEIEDAVQGILMLEEAGGTVTGWDGGRLDIPTGRGERITLVASGGNSHRDFCERLQQIPPEELKGVGTRF